ncbi:MAG: 6-carboxytetrahydropterin synthase [Chloroflexi bacterium]|nr:6-carboxytetrahydropterin synthase [Chloroflexota bacterium]
MSFRIILEHQTLRFAAAHFTTFAGECEPLHGHNYALTVEIEGDLTVDSWVLDFSEAKSLVRNICRELDHKFLLPLDNAALKIAASDGEFEIKFGDRRYVIPRSDVAELPIDNSTAERLAEYIAGRIVDSLRERGASNVTSIAVGVEEAPGQSGWFREALP